MKKFYIILMLVSSVVLSADSIVNIWADNSALNLGVSKERVWLKSYFLSNFEYYTTLGTETTKGVPTAVTASRKLFFLLDDLLQYSDSYTKDSVVISKKNGIFTFLDSSIDLEISFSLEKPDKEILNIISDVYKDDKKTEKIVTDHYLESWVIRIYSAENVISPDIDTLDYNDILISATIIGEKSQWLWGIHDGVDYLYDKLTN